MSVVVQFLMILTSFARAGSFCSGSEYLGGEGEPEQMQWAAKWRFSCGREFCNCLDKKSLTELS